MPDFDDILPVIGSFGRYQKTQFFLLCVPAGITAALIAFHSTFVSGSPEHWCQVPTLLSTNLTADQRKALSIPASDTPGIPFDKCKMYDVDFDQFLKDYRGAWPPKASAQWEKVGCKHGWEYDMDSYGETLVTKFDLVCDDDWLPPFSKSMFYLGSFIGNFVFGFISDRYGRRIALFSLLTWIILFTLISISSVNYYMYITLRFLVGFSFPSIYQIPFILALELMAPDKRTMVGNIVATMFALGLALLALIAFCVKNWVYLSLASSLPFILLFVYYWLVPESPRWLLSQNRIAEAEAVLKKAAETNGRELRESIICSRKFSSEDTKTKQPTIWDLVKTPNLRKKLLVIVFCWPINAVVYTVLSFQASGLGVNEYLGFAISGLVEIPAYVIAWVLMDSIGRRWSIFGTMLIGGIACIVPVFMPIDMVWGIISMAMIGKCGIAASFSVLYVFAGELNPTQCRSTAIGVYASFAGIALIGAPYLLYLEKYGRHIPLVACGILSVLGAISIMFLPETLYVPLPQTLLEGEEFGKHFKMLSCPTGRRRKHHRRVSAITEEIEAKGMHETDEMINGNIQVTNGPV